LQRHFRRAILSHFAPMVMRTLRIIPWAAIAACLSLLAGAPMRGADDGESMPERTLKEIVARQQTILGDAAKQGKQLDEESARNQLQEICHEYELLLQTSPDFAAAYASYGYLLGKVGMDKESLAVLLKANQLDPNIPLVKNQIGNCLAEDGKPLEAVSYYLAAIRLEPKEPLYHYQLGTLLYEARDQFLTSGEWTRESIDQATHVAFRRASELAPDRIEFTYRYAESFADMEKPDWDGALKVWAELEEKAQSPLERETMRLQAANVLIRQGKFDRARLLIGSVTAPELDGQKQKLVAQLPKTGER
jgi:tetratricopeptide (TPR) repeat protein